MAAHTIRTLTPSRWPQFERLFGERGACGGCWCMYWRVPRRQFDGQKGDGNRAAMHALVASGVRPGLLAYDGKRAIGWVSVAPRPEFTSLANSRLFRSLLDESNTWSISCLFVDKDYRRRGVSVALLEAATAFAAKQGAEHVEGYPQDPARATSATMADAFAWTGIASAFVAAGFEEVARPSPTRPVMRRTV